MIDESLTEQEKDQLILAAEQIKEERKAEHSDQPTAQEMQGIYNIFNDTVFKHKDNSKTANLSDEELIAVRALQNAVVYAESMKADIVQKYLIQKAQVLLGTSLSKKGFSITSLITSRREFSTAHKKDRGRSSWFSKNVKD